MLSNYRTSAKVLLYIIYLILETNIRKGITNWIFVNVMIIIIKGPEKMEYFQKCIAQDSIYSRNSKKEY